MRTIAHVVAIAVIIAATIGAMALLPEPAQAQKMDATTAYRVRQALQRQERNIAEVERLLAQMTRLIGKAKYLKSFDDHGIPRKLKGIARDVRTAGAPEDFARFVKLKARVQAVERALPELAVKAQPAIKLYKKYTDMANYPDYSADLERTQQIGNMYDLSANSFRFPAKVTKQVEQFAAIAKYINGNARKYAPLINFKTPEGLRFQKRQKWAIKSIGVFVKQRKKFKSDAPGAIRVRMSATAKMLARADKERNPMLIPGGVEQGIAESKTALDLYTKVVGADDAEAAKLASEHAALVAKSAAV